MAGVGAVRDMSRNREMRALGGMGGECACADANSHARARAVRLEGRSSELKREMRVSIQRVRRRKPAKFVSKYFILDRITVVIIY